jgi:hypothetical protein
MTATVTLFVPDLNHTVETIAFYLTHGADCRIRIVTNFKADDGGEDPWCLHRLKTTHCELVRIGSPPEESDLFIFGLIRHGKMSNEVMLWRRKSLAAAFLISGIFYDNYKNRLRELVRSWPHYLGASHAIYQRSPVARWQTFPFYGQRPVYYSPYLHPEFFVSTKLDKAFGVVKSSEQRRFRLGFLGNGQPAARAARLAQCRQAIDEAGLTLVGDDLKPVNGRDQALWVEYGGPVSRGSNGLEPSIYLHTLTDLDFCISPPGYEPYTHRTVEAIVRGSVPILAEPRAYDLDLRDGENCIIVNDNNWLQATRRALDLLPSDVLRMRRAVLALREERLVPAVAGERFCTQLLANVSGTPL